MNCRCGKALRSDNKSGLCGPCYSKSPERALASKKYAEQDRARARAWNADNKERAAANAKAYAAKNRDQIKGYVSSWQKMNMDKMLASTHAYQARRLGLFVERVERTVVWQRDRGICHLCSQSVNPNGWHLEHVISLSEGGPHCYDNTAVAHGPCNNAKRGRSYSPDGARWAAATGAYKKFHGKEYE